MSAEFALALARLWLAVVIAMYAVAFLAALGLAVAT